MKERKFSDKLALAASQKVRERDYWLTKLSGELVKSRFPYDSKKNKSGAGEESQADMKSVKTRFHQDLCKRLLEVSRQSDYTLLVILIAGVVVVLHKYTGHRDIIVETPIYRQSAAGEFINTVLPLRIRLNDTITFKDLLIRIKQTVIEAVDHQSYPMEILVDRLNIPETEEGFGLFYTAILLRNIQDEKDLAADPPMTFSCLRTGQDLEMEVHYRMSLYSREGVRRITRHLEHLLTQALEDVDVQLSQLEPLTAEEKEQLLAVFNRTHIGYPAEKTIHQLFEEQEGKTPDHIAVFGMGHEPERDGRTSLLQPMHLTYRQLNEQSDKLALLLRTKGVKSDTIVAIMPRRSVDMVTGIIGILKAGGAYLPVDSEYPEERIKYMLADSSARLLVTTRSLAEEVENSRSLEVETMFIEEIGSSQEAVDIREEQGRGESMYSPALSDQQPRGGPDGAKRSFLHHSSFITHHLAYIIYTSGTTGTPKGVMIDHRNVVRLFFNESPLFDFNTKDVWTLFHSYCFDFSVWEMYGALLYGGKLLIISRQTARDPGEFLEILIKNRVTVLNQTPSAFYSLIDEELKRNRAELTLRYVIFGGEALKPSRLKEWQPRYPGTKLVNMFGITETTVHVTYKEITSEEVESNISSIGKPIPTLGAYVMDTHLNLLPAGVFGELNVAGLGVGRGYLNQPGLTAGKFVPDPFQPGERLYRSGDLVRVMDNLDMEYSGRLDQQVQIRGFRVELGEIETRLLRHPAVKETLVLSGGQEEEQYICAYIVAKHKIQTMGQEQKSPGTEHHARAHVDIGKQQAVPSDHRPLIPTPGGETEALNIGQLRRYLSTHLPDYMIPNYFVFLETFPLTPNGKVDRKALPKPGITEIAGYTPPGSELEEKMAVVWSEVLGIEKDRIGIDSDFFELGGHSLRATIMVSRIHKELHVKIPLEEVFRIRTIRGMARYAAAAREDIFVSVKPTEEKDHYDVSSAQRRLYLFQQVNRDSIVYNESSANLLDIDIQPQRLRQVVKMLIQRHESLRTSFELVEGNPVQRIHPPESITAGIEYQDLSGPGKDENEADIQEIVGNFIRPFDLGQVPLFRVGLVKLALAKCLLMLDMHHIVVDGASGRILAGEFVSLYQGEQLPPLLFRYKDYSEWQKRLRAQVNSSLNRQKEYWLQQFRGEIPLLNLATDLPRPDVQRFEGDSIYVDLTPEETRALRKLAVEEDATLYMVLLAVFNLLFSRLASQEDIVLGVGTAGRSDEAFQQIIGMFVNTLALRNFPGPEKTFCQFLEEVKQRTLAAFENQDYPFEDLTAEILPVRDRSRNPLFDVVFAFDNIDAPTGGIGEEEPPAPPVSTAARKRIAVNSGSTKFDISIIARDEVERISFLFQYSTALFKRETIRRYTNYFKELVQAVISDRRKKLKDFVISHDLLGAKLNVSREDFQDFGF